MDRAYDRDKMARIARDLAAIELDADESPTVPARTRAAIDLDRSRRGAAPLADEPDPPEQELYRRARALGLRRIGG